MNTLTGEVLTLPKMNGSVSTPKSLSGNVGAKTINIGGKGDDGATFIPSVSSDGVISWTNDKDLPNPEPVNIKGVKGDKGDKGDRGLQGIQGVQGAQGLKGEKGDPGTNGKDGKDGENGQPGKDGSPGKDGADGFSPVVVVEDIAGGHRVIITDKEGEKVFDVMDGKDSEGGNGGNGVSDVQLNGTTIVDENGIATIPIITAAKGGYGIARIGNLANGNIGVRNSNGAMLLCYPEANDTGLTNRKSQGSQYSGVVSSSNFDLAVKLAMTDGVGAAWTEEEQAAARTRMGAVSLEEVLASLPIYEGEVETV